MIILDTCALIFDALAPEKLTKLAKKTIIEAEQNHELFCCDISLWEIAMLIKKKRLDPSEDTEVFLRLVLDARGVNVLPINVEIASISGSFFDYAHYDPADRLIAATSIHHNAALITSDSKLSKIEKLTVIW